MKALEIGFSFLYVRNVEYSFKTACVTEIKQNFKMSTQSGVTLEFFYFSVIVFLMLLFISSFVFLIEKLSSLCKTNQIRKIFKRRPHASKYQRVKITSKSKKLQYYFYFRPNRSSIQNRMPSYLPSLIYQRFVNKINEIYSYY